MNQRKLAALLLILFLPVLFLFSCSDGSSSDTPSGDGQTEPFDIAKDPADSLGRQLSGYCVVNNSGVKGAEDVLLDALARSRYELALSASTDANASPRIELTLDDTLAVAQYQIEKTDFGVRIRMRSGEGVWFVSEAFKNHLDRSGSEVPAENAVLVRGIHPRSCADAALSAKQIWFEGETDKSPLTYHVGDDIVFNVRLLADGSLVTCPKFSWEAFTDDGHTYRGEASGMTGQLSVAIPATGKGFVRFKCLATDERGKLLAGVDQGEGASNSPMFGAGVDVEEFGVEYPEPADFDEFWEKQLAALDKVAPDIIKTESIGADPSWRVERVMIACTAECEAANAYITYPANASKESLPIKLYFSGYGTQDNYYENPPTGTPGCITVRISPHALELGHEASYYDSLSSYGLKNNDSIETCYFRKVILREVQCVRFAKAFFGKTGVLGPDGKKIAGLDVWNGEMEASGGSQGGFQSIVISALEPAVTTGSFSIPWMCDAANIMTASASMRSTFHPTYGDALAYVDTINFAKRIPAANTVTVSLGLGDYVCPPSGVFTMLHQLKCPATVTVTQGRMHGYTPPNASSVTFELNK